MRWGQRTRRRDDATTRGQGIGCRRSDVLRGVAVAGLLLAAPSPSRLAAQAAPRIAPVGGLVADTG
ncbi:MAG TPA: hypothetical protein VFV33_17010, partial [Gemmatimonadaceae bacterium]|nr:hypothetical protein [Gemmatimonadaceae bacterium]